MVTLLVAMIVGVWIGFRVGMAIPPVDHEDDEQGRALFKMNYALNVINKRYVDSIALDTLVDQSLNALLFSLDPHSSYLSQEDFAREEEQIEGQIEGIGVLLNMKNDTVRLLQVLPQSPAEQTILRPGDQILAVNGEAVAGQKYSLDKIISKIKGPRNSPVTLSIHRYGETTPRNVTMRRNAIPTPSIAYHDMLTDTIGYVYISSFTLTTGNEFRQCLQQLKARGMRHLILDLRGNGGGLMAIAESVANELLPADRLIVYVQGAHQPREETYSTGGGLFTEGSVTVLINENSASSSEIVAGAIQDNDRGLVVGRRSFGKGLVQNRIMLPDHSAMHITTARYYTPSGRCIQRAYDNGSTVYMLEHYLNMYNDSAYHRTNDTVTYHTREGRIVYGGGGIMPDYLLQMESDKAFVYYNELRDANLYSEVALNEVTRHWEQLTTAYPDADSFVKNYTVSNALFEQLLRDGDAKKIKRNPVCIHKYGHDMRRLIKAEMARYLYGDQAYFPTLLPADTDLSRTLRLIEEGAATNTTQTKK